MLKKSLLVCCGAVFLLICSTGTALAISTEQEATIVDHCATIRESLKRVQRNDARARVYLGGRYEMILNKYVTPLNVKLVESNLSTPSLIESQNTLAGNKTKFADSYVEYQQRLEELVAMDCKNNPKEFYEKLEGVRSKRKKVEQEVQKMKSALNKYLELVNEVKKVINAETK